MTTLSDTESDDMRFVYTAPRYHTNQHFPIKALLEAGHEVSFLALAQGQSERAHCPVSDGAGLLSRL